MPWLGAFFSLLAPGFLQEFCAKCGLLQVARNGDPFIIVSTCWGGEGAWDFSGGMAFLIPGSTL